MKKLLFLLSLAHSLSTNAQTFYNATDMEVSFTQARQPSYWSPDFVVPTWSYSYINDKGVMCATWLIEGRFVTIYFGGEKTDIGICGAYGITKIDELNNSVSTQLQYSSGNIEFDKIVYSPWNKVIFIPYELSSDFIGSYYNIVSISLYDAITGGINTVSTAESPKSETYYNLNGQKINPATSNDRVVIKSDGMSAEKVLNKR